jgi:hypothetical protein
MPKKKRDELLEQLMDPKKSMVGVFVAEENTFYQAI